MTSYSRQPDHRPTPTVTPQLAPVRAPLVSWLVPVAALLAVLGAFTPWFEARGTYRGQQALASGTGLYAWQDGKIGLAVPLLLVVVGVSVVGLMQGKTRLRLVRGPDRVRSLAMFAIGAGVASALCLVIAWFLVPGQYHFVNYSWDKLESLGVHLSRRPQIGFFLTIAAALLAIVGGALMLITAKPVGRAEPVADLGPPPVPS